MKKILTLLFLTLLAFCLPVVIYAEEGNTEVTGNEGTVELYANIPSRYFVKLPARIDVSNTETAFDVFVRGDVAADQKLDISCAQSGHMLADTAGSGRTYALEVAVSNGTFVASQLSDEYQDQLKATFTVAHAALSAGKYSYHLPVLISLSDAS